MNPIRAEEVIEDPEGVKRLGHHALYLGAVRARLVWTWGVPDV